MNSRTLRDARNPRKNQLVLLICLSIIEKINCSMIVKFDFGNI
jgi:hypothetical protein